MSAAVLSGKIVYHPVVITFGKLQYGSKYASDACNCDVQEMENKNPDASYPYIRQERKSDNDDCEWNYDSSIICCKKQLDKMRELYVRSPHTLDLSEFQQTDSPIDLTSFFDAPWHKIKDPKNVIETYKKSKVTIKK